jgi:uncharacterized protein (DUF302 family)
MLFATSAVAGETVVRVESAHDVATSIDRLQAAVEGAGAKVFARIDHAAGAESVGEKLAPSTLLIFGNPKLGTPAMQAAPEMGLSLPMKVLAMEQDGKTWLIYDAPGAMAASRGLAEDHPVVQKMTGALGKLTAKAAGE